MLKSNWALESLPELVGTLSKIESFEGSWPVFWCSKVRKMTFWKKQVLVLGWLAVFLESLIDNGAASFQIDSSSSLPGPILEQSSPSLSPCHHPVVQCWLGHSIGKRNSPPRWTEKWQRKPKKKTHKKKQGMMTKTTRTTFLSFLAIFEDSTVICDSFHTFCCDRYDRQSETYRRTGTVTSLTTVSLNYYHCLLLPLDFAATSYNEVDTYLQYCLESLGKNWQGRNNVPVSPHLTIGRN